MENKETTAEQLKEIKNAKIRKNLRLLAIGVACYYFISAAFSWYEEANAPTTSPSVTTEFTSQDNFVNTLTPILSSKDLNLNKQNAKDNTSFTINERISLHTTSNDKGEISSINLSAQCGNNLDDTVFNTIESLIKTTEGANATQNLTALMDNLSLNKNKDLSTLKNVTVQSDTMRYVLTVDPQDNGYAVNLNVQPR